ncbi:MAG: ATP synthase F1 subunit delta [Candidatus Izemoplasmatales bacterium]|nr:ATP synthase F1 subunit delta [Candidatus Izemoplasmatales bacterium]
MMETARQYALAVFQLALEKGNLKGISLCFDTYQELENEDHLSLFNNPRLTKKERKDLLKDIVSEEDYRNFLYVLIDNDRFELLQAIRLEFEELIRDMGKILKVKVVSREPLDQKNKERLIHKLESEYKRKIELEETIDPKIIAGFKLEYDGKVSDQTINRRLHELRTNLKQ